MRHLSITPSVTVTIGRYTRHYGAFVTTAPVALDSAATVTLHEGPLADVIGLAADPITFDELRARTPARLVLIDERSSAGNAPAAARITICCFARIPGSSASTRCSCGCGNACSRRLPPAAIRRRHDPSLFPASSTRSPRRRAFQEEEPWS